MRYHLSQFLVSAWLLTSSFAAGESREKVLDNSGQDAAESFAGDALDSSSAHRRLFFPETNCTNVVDKNFNYNVEVRFPGMVDGSYGYSTGPDPSCAAGLGSVVGVTMLNVEIHEKGGNLIDAKTLRDLFKVTEPPKKTVFQDPKVIYDSYLDVFMIMATLTDRKTFTDIYLAVSSTPEPFRATVDANEGFWNWYFMKVRVNNDGTEIIKHPGIAVDESAIYLTGGIYTKAKRPEFIESRLWILSKNAFYGVGQVIPTPVVSAASPGGILISETPLGVKDVNGDALPEIYMPAEIRAFSAKYDVLFGTYLVSYVWEDTTRAPLKNQFLHVYQINDALVNPPTIRSFSVEVDVEDVSKPLPNSTQPDDEWHSKMDTQDRRVQKVVWHEETLWLTSTVRDDTNEDETAAYFFRLFAPSNDTVTEFLSFEYSGGIGGEEIANFTSTYYPAIAVNQRNLVAIGFSANGRELYTGSYVTVHDPIMDGLGETQCTQVVKAGENNYESLDGNAHWGDYSGISVDPIIDDCFWVFNSHASGSFPTGMWATHWAFICVKDSIEELEGRDSTLFPSEFPSESPSEFPSDEPSPKPSQSPSDKPSAKPSQSPSDKPSQSPSDEPSAKPSQSPSDTPSVKPSQSPSAKPSQSPSAKPSAKPSQSPSAKPSQSPSATPPGKTLPPNPATGKNPQKRLNARALLEDPIDFARDFYETNCDAYLVEKEQHVNAFIDQYEDEMLVSMVCKDSERGRIIAHVQQMASHIASVSDAQLQALFGDNNRLLQQSSYLRKIQEGGDQEADYDAAYTKQLCKKASAFLLVEDFVDVIAIKLESADICEAEVTNELEMRRMGNKPQWSIIQLVKMQ